MKVFVTVLMLLMSHCLSSQVVNHQLIARNTGSDTLWDATIIRTMGFATGITENVKIPGPMLVFTEGDSIEIDLWNISQGAPHTIHLHGLDVDQQNDGVGHLSFYVHHMDHGFYRFRAPHPGTYLYHCHVVSPVHVQGGMYGMIVVKPKSTQQLTWSGGYEYHRDYNWLASEVDTNWHKKSIIEHAHDTTGHFTMTIPPYLPQFFLINGKSEWELNDPSAILSGKANETIYLRLANIGNYGNTYIFPGALHAKVISSDGRALPQVEITDTLEIYPGERYGILFNPTEQFQDSIQVLFTNLNTEKVASRQVVPVKIEGFLTVEEYEASMSELILYPNPVERSLNLRFKEVFSGHVKIYDNVGQEVYAEELTSEQHIIIDIPSFLANGMYFVTLQGIPQVKPAKFNLVR